MFRFLIGLGAGVAIGAVLARRSGAGIRGTIGEKVKNAATSAADGVGEIATNPALPSILNRPTAPESTPDMDEEDSRDELGLPMNTNAVRL